MTPEIALAIEQLRANFPDCDVAVREDGEGGAYVKISEVSPGPVYKQECTWVGFRVTFQYPYADVYPHYFRPDLERKDGQPLGEGFQLVQWEGRPAAQVSRRSNRLNPHTDTATLKLQKVLQWIATRS